MSFAAKQVSSEILPVPKYYQGTVAAGANQTIISAVSTKKIRVLSYSFQADKAGTVKLLNHSGATILPEMNLVANQFVSETCVVGLFETLASTALDITATVFAALAVRITYQEI